MDVRRLNSTPLADTGGEGYSSCVANSTPHSSPRTNSGRLPALWKTLKSKLGALSSSKSVNSLVSLAADASASLSGSPPKQAAVPSRDMSTHSQMRTLQNVFHAGTSLEDVLGRQDISSLSAASQQVTSKAFCRGSSPSGLCNTTIGLPTRTDNSCCSASNTTARPNSAEPALPSAPAEPPVASTLDNSYQVHCQGQPLVAEAAPTPNRKLLAVSPALPGTMRRSVWAIEDFIICRRLFKGSSSAVYRATCRRSGLPVALKVYFLSRVPANVVHMLKREIEIHSQLVHRHVARLHAAFMDEGDRVVLVQEYAAQGDLYGVLQRLGGRMHHEQVADCVMRPFLEALSYLHSKGVCHRDIKPENILFTGSWRLLIADFGVSINLNRERAVTRAGTEGYMAPEVERCPLKTEPHENKDDPRYAYSAAVDIWAVGVLAYELLVGFPPVVAMSTPAGSAPAPPCALSPEAASDSLCGFVQNHMTAASLHFPASVPTAARSFVLAALCPDPLERPTAAQLLTHAWLQREQTGRSAGAGATAATSAAGAPDVMGAAQPPAPASGPAPIVKAFGSHALGGNAGQRRWDENSPAPKPPAGSASVPAGQWPPCAGGSRPPCSALCTPA